MPIQSFRGTDAQSCLSIPHLHIVPTRDQLQKVSSVVILGPTPPPPRPSSASQAKARDLAMSSAEFAVHFDPETWQAIQEPRRILSSKRKRTRNASPIHSAVPDPQWGNCFKCLVFLCFFFFFSSGLRNIHHHANSFAL